VLWLGFFRYRCNAGGFPLARYGARRKWLVKKTGKRFGKDRCAQSQEPRWYLVDTGRCRPQRIEHSEHVHLWDEALIIIWCRQFQSWCSIIVIGRDGCVVCVERLRSESVNVFAETTRLLFNHFTHFRPGVFGALFGVSLPQPLRANARDDGAYSNSNCTASSIRPARIRRFLCRNSALTVGVTYGGSDEVSVISRSG